MGITLYVASTGAGLAFGTPSARHAALPADTPRWTILQDYATVGVS